MPDRTKPMALLMSACRLIDYFASSIGFSAPHRTACASSFSSCSVCVLFVLRLCFHYYWKIIVECRQSNKRIYISTFSFFRNFMDFARFRFSSNTQYRTNIIIRSNMWRLCRPTVRVQDRVIEIIMFTSSFCGRGMRRG